ncbi:MAG: 1-deoxy-D-xylulose-5-phosphate reductoisomerase [Phycisphaerales bacterium]|nr:MAG: 1-deoxy-D-xylulose-5-phosphate reductoisomerase [Phycisphaerales bacterium]
MKKRVTVLGATGSIGRNTLDVLRGLRDEWDVVGLAAHTSVQSLAAAASEFKVEAAAITCPDQAKSLKARFSPDCEVFGGENAMLDLVNEVPCDCVVVATVGTGGLTATIKAAEMGRRIALANKEALVMAGSVLIPLAERSGSMIIPIDSEHSAIFQALQAGRVQDVHRVYLTASGGPFRTWTIEEMDEATLEDALRHPTWDMGPKTTIDSATMMNKALEIVEARWLFGLASEQIQVVIHPESIIHSLVEFKDGSMIAQLGAPDMRTPIQYALTYPARKRCPSEQLDLTSVSRLHLHPPDMERFPALRLGHEVARRGGTCGAVMNAANEVAVQLFQKGEIHYRDIARVTEAALERHESNPSPTLKDILAADRWAREEITRCAAC